MSDFAKAQLEKFGWKEGKGLGKDENGITKPIKATLKSGLEGLGYDEFSDNWWQKTYNKSVNNIQIEKSSDEVAISVIDEGVWEDNTKKKKNKKKPKAQLGYSNFQKTTTLHNGHLVVDDTATLKEEKETTQDLVNASSRSELLYTSSTDKIVTSEAASSSMSIAKLSRIAVQESLFATKSHNNQSMTPDFPLPAGYAPSDFNLPSKYTFPFLPSSSTCTSSNPSWTRLLSNPAIIDAVPSKHIVSNPRLSHKCIALDPSSVRFTSRNLSPAKCTLPNRSPVIYASSTYFYTSPVICTSSEKSSLPSGRNPILSDSTCYRSSHPESNTLDSSQQSTNTLDRTVSDEEDEHKANNNTLMLQSFNVKSKSRHKKYKRKVNNLTKLLSTCSMKEIDKKSDYDLSNEKICLRKTKKHKKECRKVNGKVDYLQLLRKQSIPLYATNMQAMRLASEEGTSLDEKQYVRIIQFGTDDDTSSPKEENNSRSEQMKFTRVITMKVKGPQCNDMTSNRTQEYKQLHKNIFLNISKRKNKKRQRSKIEDVIKNITNKQNANVVDVVTNALQEINLTEDMSKAIKKKPTQTHITPV